MDSLSIRDRLILQQPLWILPEANIVTTPLKYSLNSLAILQSVHLNCFAVSQAASKLLPCYLYLQFLLHVCSTISQTQQKQQD